MKPETRNKVTFKRIYKTTVPATQDKINHFIPSDIEFNAATVFISFPDCVAGAKKNQDKNVTKRQQRNKPFTAAVK